ncbi:hypothetical protein Bbelb_111020 [Branchiostoma belcheri]|nr:hypothetical protein Bbelb_111020 [Branchiostoma belcheri]
MEHVFDTNGRWNGPFFRSNGTAVEGVMSDESHNFSVVGCEAVPSTASGESTNSNKVCHSGKHSRKKDTVSKPRRKKKLSTVGRKFCDDIAATSSSSDGKDDSCLDGFVVNDPVDSQGIPDEEMKAVYLQSLKPTSYSELEYSTKFGKRIRQKEDESEHEVDNYETDSFLADDNEKIEYESDQLSSCTSSSSSGKEDESEHEVDNYETDSFLADDNEEIEYESDQLSSCTSSSSSGVKTRRQRRLTSRLKKKKRRIYLLDSSSEDEVVSKTNKRI